MSKKDELAGLVRVYMDQAYNPLTLQPCARMPGEPVVTALHARTMGSAQELIVIDPTGTSLADIHRALIGPGKRYEDEDQMRRAARNGAPNAFVRGRIINDGKPEAGDLTGFFCLALLAHLPLEHGNGKATIIVAEDVRPVSSTLRTVPESTLKRLLG